MAYVYVLAETGNRTLAIGPVHEEQVDEISLEISDHGWKPRGTVVRMSVEAFGRIIRTEDK